MDIWQFFSGHTVYRKSLGKILCFLPTLYFGPVLSTSITSLPNAIFICFFLRKREQHLSRDPYKSPSTSSSFFCKRKRKRKRRFDFAKSRRLDFCKFLFRERGDTDFEEEWGHEPHLWKTFIGVWKVSRHVTKRNDINLFRRYKFLALFGQCLWLSWQSGRFQQERSAVRIQSSTTFFWTNIFCQLFVKKTKIEKKRPGMVHFKKSVFPWRSSIGHLLMN